MLRVLLVDDERPARNRLAQLLAAEPGVEIVGEAEDGEQALERIAALAPDVVLLDIQMPGCGGLEVAASLAAGGPRVVFCTAFDEHAVDAFELNAVDYLLKPVSRARLAAALARVRATASPAADAPARLAPATGYPARFLGRRGPRFHVVGAADVVFFSSEEGQTRLQARELHYWMQPTLADLERRLDPARFFRVSRAAIVNLDAVREVAPREGGHGEATLSNGMTIGVSRRRMADLMGRLGA